VNTPPPLFLSRQQTCIQAARLVEFYVKPDRVVFAVARRLALRFGRRRARRTKPERDVNADGQRERGCRAASRPAAARVARKARRRRRRRRRSRSSIERRPMRRRSPALNSGSILSRTIDPLTASSVADNAEPRPASRQRSCPQIRHLFISRKLAVRTPRHKALLLVAIERRYVSFGRIRSSVITKSGPRSSS